MVIKTGNRELPVYFGMNALAKFGDLTGRNMNKVMSDLSNIGDMMITELLAFIYAGFYDGARKEGTECAVEGLEEVGDMLDDDTDLLTKVMTAYQEQSVPPEDVEEDDKKK